MTDYLDTLDPRSDSNAQKGQIDVLNRSVVIAATSTTVRPGSALLTGGSVNITAGSNTDDAGAVNITAGAALGNDGDGGNIVLTPGAKNGTGVDGRVKITLSAFDDDAAAATGGVPVGGLYRTASAVMVRVA